MRPLASVESSSGEDSDSFNDMLSLPSSDEAVQAGRAAIANTRQAHETSEPESDRAAHSDERAPGATNLPSGIGGVESKEADEEVYTSFEGSMDSTQELAQQTIWADSDPDGATRFGWDGRLVAHEENLIVPDDTYPVNSRCKLNVTSLPDGAGLAEAVQVMPACSTMLIRAGYYKWQIGGMPSCAQTAFSEADDFFSDRELMGDPILVPLPLNFVGEMPRQMTLSASTYDAARSPKATVRLHGQWLLTSLPKADPASKVTNNTPLTIGCTSQHSLALTTPPLPYHACISLRASSAMGAISRFRQLRQPFLHSQDSHHPLCHG